MSLKSALLLLVLLVLAAGLVPAGVLLDRRLADALVHRTREDLARAELVLRERWTALGDVRMMHAKELAGSPGLAAALAAGRTGDAVGIVTVAAASFPERPLLVDRNGDTSTGTPLPADLVDATRRGEMPVAVVSDGDGAWMLALAPVVSGGRWVGAAGGKAPVDETEAATLAGLTRSGVVVLTDDGRPLAATPDSVVAPALARTWLAGGVGREVRRVQAVGRSWLTVGARLDQGLPSRDGVDGAAGWVVFARDLQEELAVLPTLRRTGMAVGGAALAFGLLVGVVFATGLARPAEALADAADRFALGDTDAPLPRSSVTEIRRVSRAFATMRRALSTRLDELAAANRELEDRQERLQLLQGELVQRERLAATGRMLAQLAHEIRNPVAAVRNCMEVVRRRAGLTGDAARFADMAVDELLRMHELAERMLDLHRPRDPGEGSCEVGEIAREVALLVRAGETGEPTKVAVVGDTRARAALPGDALKQVLLNLVLNAVEVSPAGAAVEVVVRPDGPRVAVAVLDRGPGIAEEALPRVFDPFFTTKDEVHGVGLGLFTAEALARTWGGSLEAANRDDGPGARFVLRLPRSAAADEARQDADEGAAVDGGTSDERSPG